MESTKQFHVPTGQVVPATTSAKLHHKVREPARTVELVPEMKQNTLISVSKFVESGYLMVLNVEEVNIYDGKMVKLEVNGDAIVKWWRDPGTGLY